MEDLSLVPGEELIKELKRRHDNFVIGGTFSKNSEKSQFTIDWTGDMGACHFLAGLIAENIVDYWRDRISDHEEED